MNEIRDRNGDVIALIEREDNDKPASTLDDVVERLDRVIERLDSINEDIRDIERAI